MSPSTICAYLSPMRLRQHPPCATPSPRTSSGASSPGGGSGPQVRVVGPHQPRPIQEAIMAKIKHIALSTQDV